MDSKFNGIIGGMSEPVRIICTNELAGQYHNASEHPIGSDSDKVLSNSMTIHALEAEIIAMVTELRESVAMDEFHSQEHSTRSQVYAAADAKVRPIYLQILELLAKANGFESYEALLEAQAQAEAEEADRKIYGGA